MLVKVILVDINPRMVDAWQNTFEENPEVDLVCGSMLEQAVGAWVTPTNARGSMDDGLDIIIKNHLGAYIEKHVQKAIHSQFGGLMPVGHATCVETKADHPRYLISTPTMVGSSEDISDSLNVALACAAAFQAVHMQNARQPGSIRSVALPGLGANTGRVPVEICADLMWTGYNLFREREFTDFAELRVALQEQLGDLGPIGAAPKPIKKPGPSHTNGHVPPQTPSDKKEDIDFDDSE